MTSDRHPTRDVFVKGGAESLRFRIWLTQAA